MKFLIDPRGGISGDMFAAALISAGADKKLTTSAMEAAASKLGTGRVDFNRLQDGATQAEITLESRRRHLEEAEARTFLGELFEKHRILDPYRSFGQAILENLLNGEKTAHSKYNIHINDPELNHGHHHHPRPDITFLHEAQDIIIDIIGAVVGLSDLKLPVVACLLHPVGVGGGTVTFSHGTLPVPAPATRILLEKHGIPWSKGPIEKELCTPTGAAILSALRVSSSPVAKYPTFPPAGSSRGSRIYDIPPLKFFF